MTEPLAGRICLFGGSFNPPHVCHVLATAWALSTLPIDRVAWMPTFAHAFGKELLPFEDRVRMVESAIALFAGGAFVLDVERELGGTSRTVDTLRVLRDRNPEATFSLLIGSDILAEVHKWKQWHRIEATTEVFVLGRGGHLEDGETFEVVLPAVSSTGLRAALREGNRGYYLPRLPAAVAALIEAEGWYREAS